MTRPGQGAPGGPLLTVAEVAAVLRVSKMTLYRMIKAGNFPAIRVGRNYRIRESDLDAFLAGGSTDTGEASS